MGEWGLGVGKRWLAIVRGLIVPIVVGALFFVLGLWLLGVVIARFLSRTDCFSVLVKSLVGCAVFLGFGL
jgi:hypothetical protein